MPDNDDNDITKQIEYIVSKAYEKYDDEIRQQINANVLDELINNCQRRKCPLINRDCQSCLTDISIENYSNIKNLLNPQNPQNPQNPIDLILNCERECNLSNELFFDYTRNICKDYEEGIRIRNKKAYWTYKKYYPKSNRITDYEGACGFIEQFHIKFQKVFEHNNDLVISFDCNDLEHLRKTIHNNLFILNGFELFQTCLIKKKILRCCLTT